MFEGFKTKKAMQALLEKVSVQLGETESKRVSEYIEYNEWGIALEHVCEVFHEKEVICSPELLVEIQGLSNRMGLDPSTWMKLQTLP